MAAAIEEKMDVGDSNAATDSANAVNQLISDYAAQKRRLQIYRRQSLA